MAPRIMIRELHRLPCFMQGMHVKPTSWRIIWTIQEIKISGRDCTCQRTSLIPSSFQVGVLSSLTCIKGAAGLADGVGEGDRYSERSIF